MKHVSSAATACALALLGLAACEKTPPATSAPTAPTVPAPDDVVITISTGSLDAVVTGLRGFADAIKPGSGAMLAAATIQSGLASMLGATSLDGIDLAGPIHLVVLDGKLEGAVLIARATDPKAIEAGKGSAVAAVSTGWAVIGAAEAVAVVEPWARAALVSQTPRKSLVATIELPRLVARHGAELAMVREKMTGAGDPQVAGLMTAYIDAIASVGADIDRLVVNLEPDAAMMSLDIGLVARKGTRLAGFLVAQKASDFALLGKLPADTPTAMLLAGHLALGPYRDGALAAMSSMLGLGDDGRLAKMLAAMADAVSGELAVGMSMGAGGMTMIELVGLDDPPAADAAMRSGMALFASEKTVESMGIRTTIKGTVDAATIDGVKVHEMKGTIDMASVPEMQRAMMERMYRNGMTVRAALAGSTMFMVVGGPPDGMARAIAASKGGAHLDTGPAGVAIERAKRRRDSAIMTMDLAGFMSSMAAMSGLSDPGRPSPEPTVPVAFSLGVAEGVGHLRVEVPVQAIQAVISAIPTTPAPVQVGP